MYKIIVCNGFTMTINTTFTTFDDCLEYMDIKFPLMSRYDYRIIKTSCKN